MANVMMICGFKTDLDHVFNGVFCDMDRNLYLGLINLQGELIEVPLKTDLDSFPCSGFVAQHLADVRDSDFSCGVFTLHTI